MYTGATDAARFEAHGARVVPWRAAPDFDEHDLAVTFPVRGRNGPRQMLASVEHVFVRMAAAQSDDLMRAFDEPPWGRWREPALGASVGTRRRSTPSRVLGGSS